MRKLASGIDLVPAVPVTTAIAATLAAPVSMVTRHRRAHASLTT